MPMLDFLEQRGPPWHGSSPALFVCGGAQRGGSLAEVDFVGESTSNPLGGIQSVKNRYINQLRNHDLAVLDSFAKSTKSSLPNPLGQIRLTKSRRTDRSSEAETLVLDQRSSSARTGARAMLGRISAAAIAVGMVGPSPNAMASMIGFDRPWPMGPCREHQWV